MTPVFRHTAAAVLVMLLAACTPTLNWREVRVGSVTALLPCKPDHGTRTVRLRDQDWQMHMVGCEAGGSLYAISYVQLADTTMSFAVTQAWRQSALSRMHATPVTASLTAPTSAVKEAVVSARGRQADGREVHAQLRWFLVGTQLFHAAVYAPRLTAEMTEPFFADLPLR